MARIFRKLAQLLDVDTTGVADGDALVYEDSTSKWVPGAGGGGGGAPTDATYLTATANGDLSAEVVVGATPGGELGGTWASPTVDATHSGSTHAAVQAAAEATAAGALASHEADTTSVHGITNTAALETTTGAQAKVDAHVNDTSDAHDASAISIADAGSDFTATDVEGALAELQSDHETDAQNLTDHLNDSSAAHAASAISVSSTTLVGTGTDAQAVFEELDNGIADHIADSSAAHAASAISFSPTGTVAATDVQAAIAEVASEATSGYVLIQELTAGAGGVASFDFTSIPGTYRHLKLMFLGQTENAAVQNLFLRVNNDSGANYAYQFINGTGTGLGAAAAGGQTAWLVGNLADTSEATPTYMFCEIPYYANATWQKGVLAFQGGAFDGAQRWIQTAANWTGTAAITRLTLINASDFKEGSLCSLYGIL